ncbi:hypothetical protein AAFF_G00329490 [Aldrovandia affinis]|uniref:Myomesin 3 n=1 Tax=Aldrovandia affinis TaxID=143900 RepID=A0AAD7WQA0_9TELE|nr:hypothetical protein AAFF_G00329490 [Aldrovandia affinis]
MATKTVTFHCQEEEAHQMSHSMQLSSQVKKKKFQSSDEEASYSEYYPIIPGDLISAKELLEFGSFPRHRTWDVLKQTIADDEQRQRDKWTLFGNEAEKVEVEVIRNQHILRTRADRMALRREAEGRALVRNKFLEDLSLKPPDFPIPLRSHTVWQGMGVKLSCTLQGYPTPKVSWYKDGVPLNMFHHPWNYKLSQTYGLNVLEIRRCSPEDAGEYKVVATSTLGEATTFATLLVNSYQGSDAGLEHSWSPSPLLEPEALFESTFPASFVKEEDSLTLQCGFSSDLLAFQRDVAWFRDGVPVCDSSKAELQTGPSSTSLTLRGVHKEQEGVYTVCLRTSGEVKEHSAYIYVRDGTSVVPGAPGSPLDVKCNDVNRDFVFLTWTPPSADGASKVEEYYVEKCELGVGEWVRLSGVIRGDCCFPVTGLKDGTMYQFRVLAVNRAGAGRPSGATDPILTSDPAEPGRTMVVKVDRGREIIITKDQLEGQVRVPLPPTDVHAAEVSDTHVVLSWNEPDPRGRELLTFYVERSIAGRNSWQLASLNVQVSSPRFAVFDLLKGESYCFRVRSINKYGVSDPSLPSAPILLSTPQAPPSPPQGVFAVRDTDSSVLLKWSEAKTSNEILGYYLYYCQAGTSDWTTVNNKPTTNTRFTVHGLRLNKEYVFRVKSVSRAGNSEYSRESAPILVKPAISAPSPPSGIALLNCTGSEMVIGWKAPARNGGDAVRGYYLDQTDAALEAWREVNVKPVKERVYKVSSLLEGHCYQFRAIAANMVGIGKPSEPSQAFLCKEWTMPEPGCPYDLVYREVHGNSLVLLWERPLYEGQGPVTGYLVEISREDEGWTALTKEPITDTYLQVSKLKAGQTYSLRVSAVNDAGVGMPSLPSEPILAQTKPGTKEIEVGVDNDGFIFLAFESNEAGEFVWAKNYREVIDAGRARLETKNNRSTLTFTNASEMDLGLYTVTISDCSHASSSYNLTAEDLERLLERSWNIRNPLIALVSPWEVEVQEKGGIRFWLQTEPLTAAAVLHLILNDKEISSTPARKINFDKAGGLVEVLFEELSLADEGSYTAQLQDGRAKNQFTLVFVDEKFRQTLARSRANRADCKRKTGPYFLEFLSWTVTEDCELVLKCKVTNVNKDTHLKWFKDGVEHTQFVYDQLSGVSIVTVKQVTKKDAGVYRATVSDGRGEDVSTLELLDEEFEKLQKHLCKQCALSAGPMKIQSTAGGFKLYCSLKYNLSYMKNSWYFKEKRINEEERTQVGSSIQKVWIEILGPTENDKGKYTLEMFDGQDTHKRTLDLSGQVFADALLEYQRLKQVAWAEKNRARVTKGLPDVVAIMEHKSLCLTCYAEGDPTPEMFWLKNDRDITTGNQYNIVKDNQRTAITINNVTVDDSGLYSVLVRNKFGSETVHVTVSVYKHGEKPRSDSLEM